MKSAPDLPRIPESIVTLLEVRKGQFIRIESLPQGMVRDWFLRLGITEGSVVECFERLSGGTMVLRKNRQQISIGKQLARLIRVQLVTKRTPHAA